MSLGRCTHRFSSGCWARWWKCYRLWLVTYKLAWLVSCSERGITHYEALYKSTVVLLYFASRPQRAQECLLAGTRSPFLLKVWNLGLSGSLHCAMVYLRMATRHQHYDSFVYQCDISVWQHSNSLVDACVHCSHSGVLFASDDNANDDDDLFAVLSKANKSAKSVSAFLMT